MKKLLLSVRREETDRSVPVATARSKQMWALILAGAALVGIGAVFVVDDNARARGGADHDTSMLEPSVAPDAPAPSSNSVSEPVRRRTGGGGGGQAFCVRLCDGYFFPSNAASGGDATCNEQCPDAPSALYTAPAGSDDIGSAYSTSGTSYAALPVAFLFRSTVDNTCTCHRKNTSYSAMLLRDRTLRKGDIVMTPKGPVVYEGARSATVHWTDFVALANAPSVPPNVRADLSNLRSGNDEGWYVDPYAATSASSSSSPTPVVVYGRAKSVSISVDTSAFPAH